MSICLLNVILEDPSSNIYVRCAFEILCRNVLGVENCYSDLILVLRDRDHIPDLVDRTIVFPIDFLVVMDFKPALDNTLRQGTARVVKLSIFDWLFFQVAPVHAEEAVIKVDCSRSDQIIPEKVIKVPCFNSDWSCSREFRFEREMLIENRAGLIKYVVISQIVNFLSRGNLKVGIRGAGNVFRSEVIPLQNVKVGHSVSLFKKLLLDKYISCCVKEEAEDSWDIKSQLSEDALEDCLFLRLHDLGDVKVKGFVILLLVNLIQQSNDPREACINFSLVLNSSLII